MPIDWQTLCDAGVPIGAVRQGVGQVDPAHVRAAIDAALDALDALAEPEVALQAWLAGLAHHWPERFERLAGQRGRALLARLAAQPFDANRYLKLRRIAIEQLAAIVDRPAA